MHKTGANGLFFCARSREKVFITTYTVTQSFKHNTVVQHKGNATQEHLKQSPQNKMLFTKKS